VKQTICGKDTARNVGKVESLPTIG